MSLALRESGAQAVVLDTAAGSRECVYHPARPGSAAVVLMAAEAPPLFYTPLAAALAGEGIGALEAGDAGGAVRWLEARGHTRIALVGHGVAGATALEAAAERPVAAVAAVASRACRAEIVRCLSPRPLLLLHGMDDDRVPDWCSRETYRRARPPRRLLLYAGCGHDFAERNEQAARDLLAWLRRVLGTGIPVAR